MSQTAADGATLIPSQGVQIGGLNPAGTTFRYARVNDDGSLVISQEGSGAGAANIDLTQTSATGANWVTLAAHAARSVTITNNTGVSISVRYGIGTALPMPNSTGMAFPLVANTNELQIQRTDTSSTQVTIYWIWAS